MCLHCIAPLKSLKSQSYCVCLPNTALAPTCSAIIDLYRTLWQVGAAQHPQHNITILQHAQAHRILPHAHKTPRAINGVQHPVTPCAATTAVAELWAARMARQRHQQQRRRLGETGLRSCVQPC